MGEVTVGELTVGELTVGELTVRIGEFVDLGLNGGYMECMGGWLHRPYPSNCRDPLQPQTKPRCLHAAPSPTTEGH